MKQLLRKLAELHISLDARDGQLDIYDPEQNLTTELLADLKAHKLSLLSLLEQSSNGQKQAAEIPPVAPKEYYRLSSAQKRMYIQYALNKDSIAYNITQTIDLAADLDKAQLHLAFQQLVDRHEGFRTCFEMVEEQPMQRILPKVDFQVAHFFPLDSEIAETIQDFSCPFDLSKAPLIRAGLIHKADGTYILIVDIHHIVTDALSQDIIVDDFMAFYNGAQLPALDVQYKDYAEWQNSPEQIAEREKQEAFWMEELVGELPVLDIPTDFQRSQDNSDEGEYLRVYVREEDKQKLDAFCAEQQVTHSMVLCSFFSILMSKLSGQEDVMIGLSISGRDHSALERLIGMFVNLLPLRSFPERNKSFESFVDEVKGATLAALDNQNCQYDKLVEELGVQRNLGHNALFDVIFNYISRPDLSEDLTPEKTDHFTWGNASKRLDITLNVTQYINTFLLEFQYDSNLFRRETAEQMLQSFLNLLTALPETKGKKLSEVYIASAASIQAIADEQQDYFAKPTAVDTFLPASYHQQRLWFIDK
ncbi:MAG: condensation domain-containing protein, partial [Bacteroidota bacterium]